MEPLKKKFEQLAVWITGLRRQQSETREKTRILELYHFDVLRDRYILKMNPMANWSREAVWEYIKKHRSRIIRCMIRAIGRSAAGRVPGRQTRAKMSGQAAGLASTKASAAFTPSSATRSKSSACNPGRAERIVAGMFPPPRAHCCLLALFALTSLAAAAKVVETDILVFGGNAAGVSAACTAVRLGKKAVVVEYSQHIGGLTSGGLGYTDIGNKSAIGGFSRSFYQRLGKHYQKPEAWTFEPSVAERELRALLKEAEVPIHLGMRLAEVKKENGRIVEAVMSNGDRFRATMFIDCSYEGDLMAKAGVKYMVGREANARFGETLNGIRAETPKHQFLVPVDPYIEPGNPASGLLPFVQNIPPGTPGDGDASVQAYNFRLCFTKKPENRLPIPPPQGYSAARFELLGRYFEALHKADRKVTLKDFLKIDMVTPEKTDINNNGGFSTDFIGFNYNYPEGDDATRRAIWQAHLDYIAGFLTFLATDERVPVALREELKPWGLCKDEFQDTGGWPHAMYVREARRMLSAYVMTEKVCRHLETPEDAVGLGAYNMDSHNCRRIVRDGQVHNEGDVQVGVETLPHLLSFDRA